MDLESESCVLESVEDNGLIGGVDTIRDYNLVSSSSSSSSSSSTADLDKQSVSRVETPPLVLKGFGLRKWKRRVRRDLVKDSSVTFENSKALKRVLSGVVDPNAKHMHFPGPDDDGQDSLGSVNSEVGFEIAGSSYGNALAFAAVFDSDNSEDRSSKSSTAASGPKVRYERTMGPSWEKQRAKYLGGKSVVSSGDSGQLRKSSVGKSKKLGGEWIKIEKENPHSSLESADSRSSNFVFMQGASLSLSSREQDGRIIMDYNEDSSDRDAHTPSGKDNVGVEEEEETEDYSQGDSVDESHHGSSDNLDPLKEAFNSFQALQEALEKELLKFKDLGKESIPSLDDGRESSSCIHAGHERASEASSSRRFGYENMGELGLTSLDSEILNLMNNVEDLEIKLEEAKCILEVKETQIRELESTISISEPLNGGTEIVIEEIFQKKVEAEIEYIIFSRSVANLNKQVKLIEDEKTFGQKMLSKLEKVETKAENLKNQAQDLQNHCVEITEIQEVKCLKKRAFKTTSCLFIQLGLLFILFTFQLMPESETAVPT